MNDFEYTRARGAVEPPTAGSMLFAGGTDVLPAAKVGLVRPSRLVDIKTSDLDRSIERTDAGWRIGSLVTLAEVQHHAGLAADLTVVSEAAGQAATRQIRSRATVGGNLLQRSRCSYYRNPDVRCWLNGGDGCPARDGVHDHHAIVHTGTCITTQPSDHATALLALDATVEIGRGGSVEHRPIAEHFAAPTAERRSLHTLADDEIIHAVNVPALTDARSTYRKAMDRAAWQFALVGVAAVVAADGVRLAASGIAATPWRLAAVEDALAGVAWSGVTDDDIARAAEAATTGTTPLERNTYKVALLRGLVTRALDDVR